MLEANNEITTTRTSVLQFLTNVLQSLPTLLTLAIIFLYLEMIAPFISIKYFGNYDTQKIATIFFLTAYTFLIFFIAPALTSRFIFRDNLRHLGLQLPANKLKAALLISLALSLLIPFMWFFSWQSNFQNYYSLHQFSFSKILLMDVSLLPVYYFAEEFFFRGFLFIGLWRKVKWHSFWITDIIFTASHMNKPGFEILLCIPASVIFNLLTLSTRSIYPAFIVHATLGVMLHFFVNFA